MRRFQRVPAFVLAAALVCLTAAPVAAAPRAEEPPRAPFLMLQEVAADLADLFGGWIQSIFGAGDVTGDPDG